jgi:hypothetical protein
MLHRKKACFRQFEITVTSVASAQAISAGKMAMKSRPALKKAVAPEMPYPILVTTLPRESHLVPHQPRS